MTDSNPQVNAVVAMVHEYARAASTRNTAKMRELLALDDTRFREIEDHIPPPFGRDVVLDILRWMDEHPDFTYSVRYREVEAFLLGDGVAYSVAVNDWESPEATGSGRATFVFVKDNQERWRIIHGHWSAMPPPGD